MSYSPSPELAIAISAVVRAGTVVRRIQEQLVTDALSKDDRSPVTVADFTSQAIVADYLMNGSGPMKGLGKTTLVAEEDTKLLRKPENVAAFDRVVQFVREECPGSDADAVAALIDEGAQDPTDAFWTLDPIDGTKGFLRGDHYAVALAYVVGGEVELAALACPRLAVPSNPGRGKGGTVLYAARGKGAWVVPMESPNDPARRLSVSTIDDPSQARLLRSVEAAHTNTGTTGEFANALGAAAPPVGLDSQAKYAVLADGGAEILTRFLSKRQPNYREKIWDQAAGSLVVEEAGGRVTDLDGKPLDFSNGRTLAQNRGVLATNGVLHDKALAVLRQVGV